MVLCVGFEVGCEATLQPSTTEFKPRSGNAIQASVLCHVRCAVVCAVA